MSATENTDAIANQGEFHSRVAPSEPMEKGGHKPGVLASENDRAPEFHAQTLPAGTAPQSSTYTPNPDLNNQGTYSRASDTLGGATSADVHAGLGHPGQGQSSNELRHDGQSSGKSRGTGNVGRAEHVDSTMKPIDTNDPNKAMHRTLQEDVPRPGEGGGERGATGEGQPAATERVPEQIR